MVISSTQDARSLAELRAGQRCQETLLNCYCREVAGPDGQMSVGPLFAQSEAPMALRHALQRSGGQLLQLQLPQSGERLLVAVMQASPTGNFRHCSPLFGKAPGQPWTLLDWETAAQRLLRELSLCHALPPNTELMAQIRNSVAVTALSLSRPPSTQLADDAAQAYIDSEQSLTFGHPFHPAPKSREGFSADELSRYSPELRPRFALHYFAVPQEHLLQQSLEAQSCAALVAERAPAVDAGFVAVPVHPWQAGHLLKLPAVQQALRDGRLRDLGTQGEEFYPTSAIRTLYRPGHPWFYKFSLNIRITNCVRKNAWYELESALQVTRLLRPLLPGLYRQFTGLRVLEEPAFLSVDLHSADEVQNREVVEGFGMILRRSVDGLLQPQVRPLLAGALFGNHVYSEAQLQQLLAAQALRTASSPEALAERWFSDYVERLLHPVLHCYFAHGLIFEPHLQNVVIGLAPEGPRQVFLRDFEGVKLVKERHGASAQLAGLSARTRESLWYDADQGWNRIAYCLFVNNFCEAIGQLAAGRPVLQQRLWALLRHHLHAYQSRHGDPASARRINALLAGQPLPGKANLINRFFKRPDRATPYVPVTNPLATAAGASSWS